MWTFFYTYSLMNTREEIEMNTNYTENCGNNETTTRGVFYKQNLYFALNGAQSKTFKTKNAAIKWLAKFGLNEQGCRK